MDDHDLRMTFLTDRDGHTLASMQGSAEGVRARVAGPRVSLLG
jgi:hypothetical protein